MSRRDYIRFAEMVRDADYLTSEARGQLITDLGAIFKADNPRFDLARFRSACYTGAKVSKAAPEVAYQVDVIFAGALQRSEWFHGEHAEESALAFARHEQRYCEGAAAGGGSPDDAGEEWAIYVSPHYCAGAEECVCSQYLTDHHPWASSEYPKEQACRDCGAIFPWEPDRDYCFNCVPEGETS